MSSDSDDVISGADSSAGDGWHQEQQQYLVSQSAIELRVDS